MLLAGKVGSLVIKMAVSVMVANYLLTYGNGLLNTATAYVFLFASVAGLGLDSFIVKELHKSPMQSNQILGTAFGLKLAAGLACLPLIALVWFIFPLTGINYYLILILSFTGALQSFTVIDSYFQSAVQSKYIMQVQIIGNLISAGIKIMLIIGRLPLTAFFISYTADIALLSIGYVLVYNRKGRSILQWHFNSALAKQLLQQSWPLILSGIMISIYMKIDAIMLKEMLGQTAGAQTAGAYATVVQFSEALNFMPLVIVGSLFPAILNAKRDDQERYKKRLQNLYDLMVWLSLSFAICITVASPIIYQLFNAEYASAATVLQVHVWGSLFVFLGVASTQVLIAEGLNTLTFIRTGFGAVVNIVLNLLLIPKMGMMGTAIATVIAYFSSTFLLLAIPKTQKQGIMMLKSLFLVSIFQKLLKH